MEQKLITEFNLFKRRDLDDTEDTGYKILAKRREEFVNRRKYTKSISDSEFFQIIKRDMHRLNKSFIDTFESYFNPIANGFQLHDYEGAKKVIKRTNTKERIYGGGNVMYGWTDSRVLMINRNYYNKILEKI